MSRQKLVPYIHSDGEVWKQFFVDTRSEIIYFEAKINGRRIKFSTKERMPNGVKAKRFANAELDRRLGRKKIHARNLIREELDLFEKVKDSENLSYFTQKAYKRGIAEIKEFWGDMLPNEINRDNLALWYEWWAKNKEIQMENVIKWMRNFCRYLTEKTHNGHPLLPAIPTIVDPNRKKILISRAAKKEKILSPDDFKKIHETAEDWIHQIIVLFMYTMASRVDETLKLDFERTINLDLEVPIYRWFEGQNKADRVGQHALHTSLIEPLKRLRALRKSEGTKMLFPQKFNNQVGLSEQQIDWQAWRDRANIGWHWTPHTFRHTCLTNVLNDPRVPQLIGCKQYRVSPQVAMKTYVKTKAETMLSIRDVVEVKL